MTDMSCVRQMEEMLNNDQERWLVIRPARGLWGEFGMKVKLMADRGLDTRSICSAMVLHKGVASVIQAAYDEFKKERDDGHKKELLGKG